MVPKHHPTPLSGGDRKALNKELGKARATSNILAMQSEEARGKGYALIRQADKLLCESWNERMWSDGGPIDPSPTIDQAVNDGLTADSSADLPRTRESYVIANPHIKSCDLGDFLRSGLLHGAHVEIEQTLALVALFLILLSKLDDLLEDLHVKPFPFSLREHFLLLVVQLLQFGVQIFNPFNERANLAAGMVTSDVVPP
jgi:hypothetical protein